MPDGKSIVFEQLREKSPRSDIASIAPDGKNVRTILSTKAWETNPVPSPDGTRIVFTSDRDRRGRDRLSAGFEVYTMAVDGTDIVRVTNNRSSTSSRTGSDFRRSPSSRLCAVDGAELAPGHLVVMDDA